MIEMSRRISVNEPGQPVLTRSDVWRGLVLKADNALPFVPAMTFCEVQKREGPNQFVREIEFRGDRCHERVTLKPEDTVTFERLDGRILGTIRNIIEDGPEGLGLRFAFALKLAGEADGSPAEKAYGEIVEKDYLKAVDATLGAIRKMKQETTAALQRYYAVVDKMDLEAFKELHTEDSIVQFGNFPPLVGREAIGGAIGHFWSTIDGMKHNFINRWDTEKESVLEVKVDYTRKDGKLVSLPCVSIVELRDGKVAHLRVHIDTAPIYAEASESQAAA
jgi:ketosteroid isomerase-like protein